MLDKFKALYQKRDGSSSPAAGPGPQRPTQIAAHSTLSRAPSRSISRNSFHEVGKSVPYRRMSQASISSTSLHQLGTAIASSQSMVVISRASRRISATPMTASPDFRNSLELQRGIYEVLFAQYHHSWVDTTFRDDQMKPWHFDGKRLSLKSEYHGELPKTLNAEDRECLVKGYEIGSRFIDGATNEKIIGSAHEFHSQSGGPTIISLIGPSGVGKTSLLHGENHDRTGETGLSLGSQFLSTAFTTTTVGVLSVVEVRGGDVFDLILNRQRPTGSKVNISVINDRAISNAFESDCKTWASDAYWYSSSEADLQALLRASLAKASKSHIQDRDYTPSASVVAVMITTITNSREELRRELLQNQWSRLPNSDRFYGKRFWKEGPQCKGLVLLDGRGFDGKCVSRASIAEMKEANEIGERLIKPLFHAATAGGPQTQLVRQIGSAKSAIGKMLWPYLIAAPKVLVITLLSTKGSWTEIERTLKAINTVDLMLSSGDAQIEQQIRVQPLAPAASATDLRSVNRYRELEETISELRTSMTRLQTENRGLHSHNIELETKITELESSNSVLVSDNRMISEWWAAVFYAVQDGQPIDMAFLDDVAQKRDDGLSLDS